MAGWLERLTADQKTLVRIRVCPLFFALSVIVPPPSMAAHEIDCPCVRALAEASVISAAQSSMSIRAVVALLCCVLAWPDGVEKHTVVVVIEEQELPHPAQERLAP